MAATRAPAPERERTSAPVREAWTDGVEAPPQAPPQAPPRREPIPESAQPEASTAAPRPEVASSDQTRPKSRRLLFVIPILLVVGAIAFGFGYRYWYESTFFVSTDNASVTGDLVQVGSLNAGRIVATRVDIGDHVTRGQELAVVAMPQQVGAAAGGAPKLDITGTTDTLAPVISQIDGVVAARSGFVGGTVASGQPIYTLVDPDQTWVKANIDESSIWRLVPGQPVEVHVDALNRDFPGRVLAITPASASTFSLLPSGNVSGNFTKVTQYVPIKVAVETSGVALPIGTSVEVKVQVREPTSALPMPWQP
jgi:multidrug resistance efflux pump